MHIEQAIILAAGKGSRMKSKVSKPMTKVGNKKLIQYGIDALLDNNIRRIIIIYSKYSEDLVELKKVYPNIKFIKQDSIDGSLSTFNFMKEICDNTFLMLDCDIVFSKVDLKNMLKSIKYENTIDGYFAVVSKPIENNPKYIKMSNNRITDFNKKEFKNGYSGGMIYLWLKCPFKEAKDFAKISNSLGSFFNEIVKKKNIQAMFIEKIIDIDTKDDIIKNEKLLKTIIDEE